MSDLIDRQAAIDAMGKMQECIYMWTANSPEEEEAIEALVQNVMGQCFDDAAKRIEQLPSAQPNVHDLPKDADCVSRQAAIDDIRTMNPKDAQLDIKWVEMWLKQLPSAQPEIIRCKDCRFFEYDHPYIVQGIPVLGHLVCTKWGDGCRTAEDGFCFMAERRTDE